MKLSKKLNTKVIDLTNSVKNFSKSIKNSAPEIEDFCDLVTDGDKSVNKLNNGIEKAIKKFNKVKTFCKNFTEDAKEISDDINSTSARLDTEVTDMTESDQVEAKKFSRKLKVLARRFSEISDNLNNITTEAEAIVNMDPDEPIKPNKEKVSTKAESIDNNDGDSPEGGEVTTQENDIQSKPESVVNFSFSNYYNFAVKNIKKSFAEIKDDIDEADDVVQEVSDEVIEQEPEIKPEESGDTPPTPPTEETTTEEVTEDANTPVDDNNAPEVTDENKELDEVVEFGEEAIMKGDTTAQEELEKKLNDLEEKSPGAGEEAMAKLENFSAHFRKFKNFSASNNVFDKIKQFAEEACKDCPKNIDAEDLGSKAENLEKMQPGAGELLTSVLECFGKIIQACKVPVAKDAPVVPDKTFCMKSFCGDIEKFVNDIKVEDKRFCRDLKAKCFALENAIEDNDKEAIKSTTSDLATALDTSDDETIKAFGDKLVKFAEDAADQLVEKEEENVETTDSEPSVAPENVQKADEELNKVLDKLDENGEQLKPEVVAFAKKLCSAYKSMKCFTEEDLAQKLSAIEELKKDFDENQAPKEETTTEEVEEVKQPETQLVEEEQVDDNQLPSDASLINFSATQAVDKDDAFGHFASLDIR